jgi:predicted transcriptional regulator
VSSKQPNSKPDLYVVARIINVLKDRGSTKRTELACVTGVAYDRLSKYVDWMSQECVLKVDDGKRIRNLQQPGQMDSTVCWKIKVSKILTNLLGSK